MVKETNVTEYECCHCGLKEPAYTEQCPVLFVDVVAPPKKCKCGSIDFIAHIEQTIQLKQSIDFININIKLDDIKLNR